VRDDDVRSSCFASLDVLVAQHGGDVPYRAGLDQGFPFRGRRVTFLSPQKGIYRAAAQRGPAALSINTSSNSPYDDEEIAEGFLYAYRAGDVHQPDNRALRATHSLNVPFVYFVSTRPGWYKPLYPCFTLADEVAARRVLVAPGRMAGPFDEREAVLLDDPGERRYAVRESASACTRRASAAGSSSPTTRDAQSAGSGRRGCSTRRTSWATSSRQAIHAFRTASASARSTTVPTTRI
jgi:hypothetical protein